jgi:hypothetical protein
MRGEAKRRVALYRGDESSKAENKKITSYVEKPLITKTNDILEILRENEEIQEKDIHLYTDEYMKNDIED